MSQTILILSTCASETEALRLARALVEDRLAACVNIVPQVISTYWWQGAVETANEYLMVIKTTDDLYAALETRLIELHSYDTPEIIAVPTAHISRRYEAWLRTEVQQHKGEQ